RTAPGPVWIGLHHYLQRWSFPTMYPQGIPGPAATDMLRRLRAANPAAFVSTGHSHRCRRDTRQALPYTEVGATKDYPGVWAGYVVHPSGIRQVVRRIAAAEPLAWNERTRAAAGHLWGRYSPGTLSQRCFVHHWPT
ncbi:MAG: hypothetical protein ACR2H3_10180, partial [Acidimicrobiales bacterium]